jgi:hypothetical protein
MSSKPTTTLGLFNEKLVAFFEDLALAYPEERDIKMAQEAIQGAKKINPRLVLDLFVDNVAKPLRNEILSDNPNIDNIVAYAKSIISTTYNEMLSALMIFDKYWPTMSDANRKAIITHLKVLVLLSDRAKA